MAKRLKYELNMGLQLIICPGEENERKYIFTSRLPAYQMLARLCEFLNKYLKTHYVIVDERKLK